MAWFKVDDGFYTSSKVLSIPRSQRLAAVGLWLMAGNWSARELSDGAVPEYVLAEIGATPKLRHALIKARLWLDHGSAGIEFHAWAEYQPTRAKVEAEREKERIRKEKYRSSQRDTEGTPPSVPQSVHPVSQVVSGDPDPTRPDPTPITSNEVIGEVPRKRATRIPDPFIVTAEMKEWAAERVPLVVVKESTERFVNHWRAKAGRDATKLDWPATWRNWLIKDQDDRHNRKLTPTERAAQTATAGRQVAGRQITSLDPKEVTA